MAIKNIMSTVIDNSARWKQPSHPWVPSPSTWVASGFIYLHLFFLPWPNYMLKLDQKLVPQTRLGLTTRGSVTYSSAWMFTLESPTNRITLPYGGGLAVGDWRLGRVICLAHPSKWHITDSGPLTVCGISNTQRWIVPSRSGNIMMEP